MYEKLYDSDAYVKEFISDVVFAEEKVWENEEVFEFVLEKTCFFPEQGGQTCDKGKLYDLDSSSVYEVIHVYIKDDTVYHIARPENKTNGEKTGEEINRRPLRLHGVIYWDERFDKMQNHSGEHLVSGTVHRFYGFDNVGFSLSDGNCTLDFNGTFKNDEIDFIEKTVNRAVFENFEVKISVPDPEELKKIEYRSKKELTGPVRIVEYPGYDICACCAPHVKRTGEIGLIKIVSAEHFKGGTRMTIRCGYRALVDYGTKLNVLKNISKTLSVPVDEADAAVTKVYRELKAERFKVNEMTAQVLNLEAEKVVNDELPLLFTKASDMNILRKTTNDMASKSHGICAVFSGDDENGYRFILCSESGDCNEVLNKLKGCFDVKGGGNRSMVQGSVSASREDICKTLLG